jgi:cytochrome c oxidase subunit II
VNPLHRMLNLPPQASSVARELDALHYFVILVTMGGAVAVSLVAAYFLFKYRREAGRGGNTPPDDRPGYTKGGLPYWGEWLMVGGLLGLFVMWWVLGYRQYVRLRVAPAGATEIYVTAKQWMWEFAYPDGTATSGVLYVPTHRPVKLLMTSRDVIHSFFVPQFRVKQDVLPERITEVWFEVVEPGTYEVLCAEYCGTNHSTMRAMVVALPESEFARMVADRPRVDLAGPMYREPAVVGQASPRQRLTLAAAGEATAARHGCLKCHTTDGSPHLGPTWRGLYGSRVPIDGAGDVLVDAAYVTESMMDPEAKMHTGFKPLMPSFRGQVDAAETAAIIEYLKSLSEATP